ncbi:MAG: hypothetical protein KC561_18150, partial [Myxococcales bacterium]|nr:hypothetical protein [Myxococcales bacterium]
MAVSPQPVTVGPISVVAGCGLGGTVLLTIGGSVAALVLGHPFGVPLVVFALILAIPTLLGANQLGAVTVIDGKGLHRRGLFGNR